MIRNRIANVSRIGVPNTKIRIQRRNFSFEPTTIIASMTEGLQLIHSSTGVPWWALIPLTTFALRSVWTLPLAIMQRVKSRKQNELMPVVAATNPVAKLNLAKKAQKAKAQAERGSESLKNKDATSNDILAVQSPLATMKYEQILLLAAKETNKRRKSLFKQHNVQGWKLLILPAFQFPLWVCMSLTMRDLCGWTSWDTMSKKPLDPSLYSEGIAWFSDLTTYDSFHVFPIALGIVALCNAEFMMKTHQLLRPRTKRRSLRPTVSDALGNMSKMSVAILMAISMHAPMALVLYWTSSQAYSLVQNILLQTMLPINYTPERLIDYKKLKAPDSKPVINQESRSNL